MINGCQWVHKWLLFLDRIFTICVSYAYSNGRWRRMLWRNWCYSTFIHRRLDCCNAKATGTTDASWSGQISIQNAAASGPLVATNAMPRPRYTNLHIHDQCMFAALYGYQYGSELFSKLLFLCGNASMILLRHIYRSCTSVWKVSEVDVAMVCIDCMQVQTSAVGHWTLLWSRNWKCVFSGTTKPVLHCCGIACNLGAVVNTTVQSYMLTYSQNFCIVLTSHWSRLWLQKGRDPIYHYFFSCYRGHRRNK